MPGHALRLVRIADWLLKVNEVTPKVERVAMWDRGPSPAYDRIILCVHWYPPVRTGGLASFQGLQPASTLFNNSV